MIENLLHQTAMQGISGSVSNQLSGKGQNHKGEVTDEIRDLGRKRMCGMLIRIGLGSDQRMVILDRIGNSWRGRRLDPDAPRSIDDFQRPGNLQEGSTAVLGFYT